MSTITPFLRAAADAYRETRIPEAIDIAARIEAHAEAPFRAERGAPAALAHLSDAIRANDTHPVVAALGPAIHDLPWVAGLIDC